MAQLRRKKAQYDMGSGQTQVLKYSDRMSMKHHSLGKRTDWNLSKIVAPLR